MPILPSPCYREKKQANTRLTRLTHTNQANALTQTNALQQANGNVTAALADWQSAIGSDKGPKGSQKSEVSYSFVKSQVSYSFVKISSII